jgi:peptidoglycan/xylan/chitin deacetylase (PgdA/CDA1 family)
MLAVNQSKSFERYTPFWAFVACILVCFGSSWCFAEEVLLLHKHPLDAIVEQQIEDSARLYGLTIHPLQVGGTALTRLASSSFQKSKLLGIMIDGDALPFLNRGEILRVARDKGGRSFPILVFGVRPETTARELEVWSGAALDSCAENPAAFSPDTLDIARLSELAQGLAGLQLPAVSIPRCDFHLGRAREKAQLILSAHDASRSVPVLLRVRVEGSDLFFAPATDLYDSSWMGKPMGLSHAFSSMAQFILFMRRASADYGWHFNVHFANFTIDDPWLTEPYGHLNYDALLGEMQRHNFHTTIAFIPWNFDRSDPRVVALFLQHQDRFSVCIHGNDHEHKEFDDYKTAPLDSQIGDIKKSVARMERFRSLTGIPYDRFMVFPHGVAPEPTFAALKRYDFLGTANSIDVPMDSEFPKETGFLLRPYTLRYAQFLSMFRYSAEGHVPRTEIAIESFLGNPILLYGHHAMFANGSGAFDEFADYVNELQPDTRWTSLGEIARNMYLIRKRMDAGFDVRMFSSEMILTNSSASGAVFHVTREESAARDEFSLTIDDRKAEFQILDSTTTFAVMIPAGQQRRIKISYRNNLDLAHEPVDKNDLHARGLRWLSDFRDIYLSRSTWGRAVTRHYYDGRWDSLELELENLTLFIALLSAVGGGIWYLRRRRTRRGYEKGRQVIREAD